MERLARAHARRSRLLSDRRLRQRPGGGARDGAPAVRGRVFQRLSAWRRGQAARHRVRRKPVVREFTVSDSGQVALPLIGNVEATDATIGEFEKRVSDRLRQGYVKEPRVSVQILNYRPFYIYGEVANPGEYPFTVGLHALKAIATAGGYTYRANSKKLFITRGKDGKKVEVKASQDTLIFPGDTIQVPERYF
ncbi:polysaccharide biosynthesis/export family protein [Hankyongella ginsenosidimutans]|uniref:polysaccharide biosynthesis/export family protein n=1 Tax=Hankyongella ginsenosidimutans TaxID=1763828 RepID=UPI001CA30277|nr:polysaccharide biosynthesis/export family protein [Hankyongella ginsenosidimutans]